MTINLKNITKRLQNSLIVNNVSLEINNAELFVLLGSSGSGKSTILRLIAGLLLPDTGKIYLQQKDVTTLVPQKRDIGFVFQNYAIFQHMTVRNNVEYGLKVRGVAANIRRQKSDELLDLVGLAGLGSRMPAQLSGGQRQRVALARALAYEPAVLLLDEPFGALDLKIRSQLRRSLREIQKQLGVTTLLVTHDQEEAFELADRIGVLERGRLLEVGTAQELYNYPKNEFVASFIGGGNVLVGRTVNRNIRIGNTLLPFPADFKVYDEGGPARIMFRPESVIVSKSNNLPETAVAALGTGRILDVNFAGANTRLRIALEELKDIRSVTTTLNYEPTHVNIYANLHGTATEFKINEQCWIGINRYHLLNSKNMHFLLFAGWLKDSSALKELARQFTVAAHGHLTLLDVDQGQNRVHEINKTTAQSLKIDSAQFDLIFKKGTLIKELQDTIQERQPDLLIFGLPADITEEISRQLVFITARILRTTRIPVLLVPNGITTVKRILICTAGGEPGKSDIVFGARLARHTRSHVTTLQVVPAMSSSETVARAEKYLSKAHSLFKAYDLEHELKVAKGNPLEQIVEVANVTQQDMVVLGASAEKRLNSSLGKQIATTLLEHNRKAVLIVPELG